MPRSLPGALAAFLAGALVAFVNYRIAAKAAQSDGPLFQAAPVLRMVLDVGALLAAWSIAPHTPWDRTWLLGGTAAGLTLPQILFTPLLLRGLDRRDPPAEKTADEQVPADPDTGDPGPNNRSEGGDQT